MTRRPAPRRRPAGPRRAPSAASITSPSSPTSRRRSAAGLPRPRPAPASGAPRAYPCESQIRTASSHFEDGRDTARAIAAANLDHLVLVDGHQLDLGQQLVDGYQLDLGLMRVDGPAARRRPDSRDDTESGSTRHNSVMDWTRIAEITIAILIAEAILTTLRVAARQAQTKQAG